MDYVYCWTMRPQANLEVELRVRASNAGSARREVAHFVDAQPAGDWTICGISRSLDGEPAGPAQLLLSASEPTANANGGVPSANGGAVNAAAQAWERAWRRA